MSLDLNLGDPAYWEVRYQKEISERVGELALFDWYCPFSDLYPMVKTLYDSTIIHKVLIIGVGRSNIIQNLYHEGYRDITAIDISQSIITEMQNRYEDYPGVEFFVMDVKQLYKFADNTFTLVFDKACIDALFCGTDYMEASSLAFNEILRVLKPEGNFLSVTYAPPIARVPYLRLVRWAVEMYKIPSNIGESLILYVITKTENKSMLDRRIPGAEAAIRSKASRVVSADQNAAKGSTNRTGHNTGIITVTASVDKLAELVAESEEVDS